MDFTEKITLGVKLPNVKITQQENQENKLTAVFAESFVELWHRFYCKSQNSCQTFPLPKYVFMLIEYVVTAGKYFQRKRLMTHTTDIYCSTI